MKLKKVLSIASIALVSGLFLAACSSNSDSSKESSDSSGKEEVVFATVGTTAPFSYEKDGKLTGFDVELAREIFKDSDKYEVKFQKIAWSSIFTGLDAGKYQMSGNNLSFSEERAQKYLYSYPTGTTPAVLAVPKDSDITSYEDIGGHTTQVVQGTSTATQLEEYNKEHADNPVELKFSSEDITQTLRGLNEGKTDFKLFDAPTVNSIIESQGLDNLKTIEIAAEEKPYIYYIFADGEDDLQKFVNDRIKELQEDGTLANLAEEYLGSKDYIPTADALKVPEN
ncbi:amino acid ABC transporter substrate-binding protein [Streptococcus agalactiae LMG 14747]|uniref:Amino acid ABC transporter substrate-binding protein n=2 Tax=Streptococcus TaxID=1301 RepID=V6Z3P7_STRAG|nr:amino acid ABC transporter substrate-binding protein [Streptococcus acidominimus]ESV54881.1 amino acid ABC transporter substrate-binding protein [Streptococcus agalactiae LMG 14747]SNV33504.1 ABC-type amino acid transport/periplasmic component/domain protein [Streptococcus acidominimus]